MHNPPPRRGFTLIELLIVVAIIAILAAIAVPNFLEAQTRSKVSRAAADMRSIATAIEAYTVDNNTWPPATTFAGNSLRVIWGGLSDGGGIVRGSVTTPIAYMSSLPGDPFNTFVNSGASTFPGITPFGYDKAGFGMESAGSFPNGPHTPRALDYVVQLPADFRTLGINANGPINTFVRDINETPRRYVLWSIGPFDALPERRSGDTASSRFYVDGRYDPTNGTASPGFLLRYEGGPSFP